MSGFHCQECGLYPALPDAIRRLHWPSPDRDSTCDCVDGLQPCPTIAALDAVLAEHELT